MAKSKKDPSRKDKLLKYKQSQKMTQAPELQDFRQVPTWQSTEEFTILGGELEALYNYFSVLAPAFNAMQQTFARGVKSGKINLHYERADGSKVSDEEVKAYTAKLNAYFKEQMAKKNDAVIEEKPTGKVVELNAIVTPNT